MIIPIKTEEDLEKFYEMLKNRPKEEPFSPLEELVCNISDQTPHRDRSKNINFILQKINEHNRKEKLEKLLS
jgi:hypothetical protein